MGSVREFAKCAKDVSELSSPFREMLTERLSEAEDLKHLIFSPSYGTTNFQSLSSVLCVTNRRWLIVLCGNDNKLTVAECSYDKTLLVELTIILLYGQVKIDFSQDGATKSLALHFNSVVQDWYSDAIQYILDEIDGPTNPGLSPDPGRKAIFEGWPLKFRNFSILHMPKKSHVIDAACWKEIRSRFGRELAPAAALLVTDRHLVLIAEEKTLLWFQFRRRAKYGAIITYFPLNRLAEFRIDVRPRLCVLELYCREGHGSVRLAVVFPADQCDLVSRVMEKANLNDSTVYAGDRSLRRVRA